MRDCRVARQDTGRTLGSQRSNRQDAKDADAEGSRPTPLPSFSSWATLASWRFITRFLVREAGPLMGRTPKVIEGALLAELPLPEHEGKAGKSERGKLLIVAGSTGLPGA